MTERDYWPTPLKHKYEIICSEHWREIMVCWWCDIRKEHSPNEKNPNALFLAMQLLNRFLYWYPVAWQRSKLQLLGGTCYMLATKIHDVVPFKPKDVVGYCAALYKLHEVTDMELLVLEVLRWRLCRFPTPLDVLDTKDAVKEWVLHMFLVHRCYGNFSSTEVAQTVDELVLAINGNVEKAFFSNRACANSLMQSLRRNDIMLHCLVDETVKRFADRARDYCCAQKEQNNFVPVDQQPVPCQAMDYSPLTPRKSTT